MLSFVIFIAHICSGAARCCCATSSLSGPLKPQDDLQAHWRPSESCWVLVRVSGCHGMQLPGASCSGAAAAGAAAVTAAAVTAAAGVKIFLCMQLETLRGIVWAV